MLHLLELAPAPLPPAAPLLPVPPSVAAAAPQAAHRRCMVNAVELDGLAARRVLPDRHANIPTLVSIHPHVVMNSLALIIPFRLLAVLVGLVTSWWMH